MLLLIFFSLFAITLLLSARFRFHFTADIIFRCAIIYAHICPHAQCLLPSPDMPPATPSFLAVLPFDDVC